MKRKDHSKDSKSNQSKPITSKRELTINERYPLPWEEPIGSKFVEISKTLSQAEVLGCSEYYIRESVTDSKEYLVGCTPDGRTWSYYLVWIRVNDVMGPYRDNSITSPPSY